SRLFHSQNLAAGDIQKRPAWLFGSSRLQNHAGYGGNRGQSLTAEPKSVDVEQVFGVLDLRGCVAFESQEGIVAHHARSIVDHLDELLASGFDLPFNARGAGIERVLEKLLQYGCRTFHHLASRDFVGNML